MLKPVGFDYFDECAAPVLNEIKKIYHGEDIFAWALSDANLYVNVFESIEAGDFLLLKKTRQQDRRFFNYFARIVYKTESSGDIGDRIWHNKKWTKILFLKEIKKIKISEEKISQQLGLDNNFNYSCTIVRKPVNIEEFKKLIYENAEENDYDNFDNIVKEYINNDYLEKPEGKNRPRELTIKTTAYLRDPAVKAWVLKNSKWTCECCDKPYPFKSIDGNPYLEVHHIKMLSEGGSDTPANTVAVCPNCHKELHFGEDKDLLKNNLYKKINRLRRE